MFYEVLLQTRAQRPDLVARESRRCMEKLCLDFAEGHFVWVAMLYKVWVGNEGSS